MLSLKHVPAFVYLHLLLSLLFELLLIQSIKIPFVLWATLLLSSNPCCLQHNF